MCGDFEHDGLTKFQEAAHGCRRRRRITLLNIQVVKVEVKMEA